MRRKKTKVVWLPVDLDNRLGTAPLAATTPGASSTFIKVFTGNPLGDVPTTEEIPILKDHAGDAAGVALDNTSLADLESSGYRLRRIVGKLVFFVQQVADPDPNANSMVLVTAGFIIRRVRHQGDSLANNAGPVETSPANLNNIMDPWIWRRSWMLGNRQIQGDLNVNAAAPSNILYGAGIADGPHVDAKTARVVGPEERLFLSVVCEGLNGQAQGAPTAIVCIGDIRVLGSMRTQQGNRRNATR